MNVEDYIKGLTTGNISTLGKAITLIESSLDKDKEKAEKLIEKCIPLIGNSIRIAVSGTPGVGKSTFIETLGIELIKKKKKIAVLAIDPSSALSQGSILGDKTRMEKLSNSKLAFVRPSPNSGILGGVTNSTKNAITICEAAGFDIIIIETVGVGQSEFLAQSMTDFFIYLTLIQNGDELQFSKKGILELSDVIIINKADQNKTKAKDVALGLKNSVQNHKAEKNIFICSALTGFNISAIWIHIQKMYLNKTQTGEIEKTRHQQNLYWFEKNIITECNELVLKKIKLKNIINKLKKDSLINPRQHARKIIETILKEDLK